MKRNVVVVLVVVVALGLMVWSGYQNWQRRMAARRGGAGMMASPAAGGSAPETQGSDEGLPDLRGRTAPPFTLATTDGRRVALKDYRGKAVLLNFWATWCMPCRLEMPWFVELQKQYGPAGLQVLGVDEDEEKDRGAIAPFARRIGLNYPVLLANDAANRAYGGIETLPTTFYIGRDGKVVEEASGLISRDEIEANIRKALAAGEQR